MYMSIFHEENEKTLEGTVPLKIGYFLVSVKFFWFEMARGEFSRFGVKKVLKYGCFT